ncbi:MAG: FHA domain-containing protein [Verrucomicrobia bacterium]|nr:FHA domain-containing protein [Verrucomicrobiota bacterium]
MADSPPASRGQPAWLELPGHRTHVLAGDCHIGRMAENEIVNADSRSSRRNTVVRPEGGHYVLVDLGSTNGTYLNDRRIFKPTRLQDRDVIGVGSERYVFRQPEAEGPTTDPGEAWKNRTAVAVGLVDCWLLGILVPPDAEAATKAWGENVTTTAVRHGAGVRRLPDGGVMVHWRADRVAAETVAVALRELALQPLPGRVGMAVHHGRVRVAPGTQPAEEILLGPDVTLTHRLAAAAAQLGERWVLTEAAVRGLNSLPEARPLGEQVVAEVSGPVPLFGWRHG